MVRVKDLVKIYSMKDGKKSYFIETEEVMSLVRVSRSAVYETKKSKRDKDRLFKLATFEKLRGDKRVVIDENATKVSGNGKMLIDNIAMIISDNKEYDIYIVEVNNKQGENNEKIN